MLAKVEKTYMYTKSMLGSVKVHVHTIVLLKYMYTCMRIILEVLNEFYL